MDVLRILLATMVFCISSYLAFDLFIYGFSWSVLLFCIGGFTLVHFLLPKKSSVDSDLYDMVDLILDIPYQSIALVIRNVGKLFRDRDGGIDIDI